MKRNEDFRKALGQPDAYFRQSVIDTLDQLNMQAEKEKRPQRRYAARFACSFAVLALAVACLSLSGVHLPGIPTESSVDAIRPTPTVATQLSADQPSAAAADQAVSRIPFVETEQATLTIRNAKVIDSHIKLQVEVMPKSEKTLALNWSVHPYTDRVAKIGKTPDYAGQTIMQWANDHGYELLRIVFCNAFEPAIPGVIPDIDPPKAGPVPPPAFDSLNTNKSTYEASGATVITVSGTPLPDTTDYLLGFIMQTWDKTKTDHGNHDSAIIIDSQIFGNIPFTIDEPEKPDVNTEYNPAPDVTAVQSGLDLSEKYAQGVVINTLPESNTVESDLAALTLRKADTDGYGIFFSFEVKPRQEKTLIVDTNVDPYMDSPDKIGLTPDRSGQTILEWAVEHGFEQLLDVELFSAHDDYDPTYTAGFHSYPRTPEEDGSVIVDVYGGTLSNTDLYYLCCRAVPWDMNGKNTYRDIPNGREIELALLYDQAVYTYLKIPVTGEKETPEFIAAYCSDTDAQGSSFTASLFRTSLAEYCETWTDNPDYADNWFSSLLTVPSGSPVFTQVARTPLHAYIRQENGSVIFRDAVTLPDEYPDTLSLEFTNIQDANQVDPPVTMKKTALNPDIPTKSHIDAIRPTPTVAAQLTADQLSAGQPVIEASFASLIFRKAEKTDSGIRFTIEARPKHNHSVVLSPAHLPETSCKHVADFYGIAPEDPEQPLNRWVLDQGYREALAVDISSAFPSEQYSGTIPNSYHTENCLVQADGSSVLTVTGPATEDDIYNLNWAVSPLNLKNTTDQSFIPQLAEHGNLRLEILGEENIRITAMPNSMEQYLSQVSFLTLGFEETRTVIQVEALPLHKNSLILAPSVNVYEDSPDQIGKTPDYEGQTILQWAQKHGCPELIKISSIESLLTPADYSNGITGPEITYGGSDYANHRENGSVVFRIYSSDVSSTNISTLQLTFHIWDTEKEYSRNDEGYEDKTLILYTQFLHDFAS